MTPSITAILRCLSLSKLYSLCLVPCLSISPISFVCSVHLSPWQHIIGMVVVEYLDCNTVTNVKQEQCLFGTLRLLNFNVYAAEEQYKIGFKPEMFRVPCAKGLEVV